MPVSTIHGMLSPPVLVERPIGDTVPVVTQRINVVLSIDRDVIADVIPNVATTDVRTISDVWSVAKIRPIARQRRGSIARTSRQINLSDWECICKTNYSELLRYGAARRTTVTGSIFGNSSPSTWRPID
jgi:hypothetical protein